MGARVWWWTDFPDFSDFGITKKEIPKVKQHISTPKMTAERQRKGDLQEIGPSKSESHKFQLKLGGVKVSHVRWT